MPTKIKANGTYKDVKSIWRKVNGVWQSGIVAWRKVNGVWEQIAQSFTYFYNEGIENINWVEGYSKGSGYVNKQPNYLQISVTGGDSHRGYVTDVLVDLSNINTLYVDWEQPDKVHDSDTFASYFIVSSNKIGDHLDWTARVYELYNFDRKITSLDVSSLSGEYYIRVSTRFAGGTTPSPDQILRVYKIWGE